MTIVDVVVAEGMFSEQVGNRHRFFPHPIVVKGDGRQRQKEDSPLNPKEPVSELLL